ncbi:hypothetical protein ACQP1G_22010 [Nocardia sp. CA-107356]|uniref:hypothetical protein n=1 Tax=Nocardia sp. CA-107356 TaxID=3239972 RepID=UPI003D8BAB8B
MTPAPKTFASQGERRWRSSSERSATIEIIDAPGKVLALGRYGTDKAGYAEMLNAARRFADRVWAVEGCDGIGRHIAHRLVHDGEPVIDVPAKLLQVGPLSKVGDPLAIRFGRGGVAVEKVRGAAMTGAFPGDRGALTVGPFSDHDLELGIQRFISTASACMARRTLGTSSSAMP